MLTHNLAFASALLFLICRNLQLRQHWQDTDRGEDCEGLASAKGASATADADADDDAVDAPSVGVGGRRIKLHAVLQKAALRSRGLSGAGTGNQASTTIGAMSLADEDWTAVGRQLGISPLDQVVDGAGRPASVAAALRELYTVTLDSFVRGKARAIKAAEYEIEHGSLSLKQARPPHPSHPGSQP